MSADDMWRVDMSGYPVSVRGEEAYRHLQAMNMRYARMKMALHRIADINNGPDQASGEWRCMEAAAIAREALS